MRGGRESGVPGPPASSTFTVVCPADRHAVCSLRTAALAARALENGPEAPLPECQIGVFLSLSRGHRVAVRDHETGALWLGQVDMTFPDHGFVWIITDFGERKLFDIGVHTIWRPEESAVCGDLHQQPGHPGLAPAATTGRPGS